MISVKLEYQILGCALPLTWRSQQEIIGPRRAVSMVASSVKGLVRLAVLWIRVITSPILCVPVAKRSANCVGAACLLSCLDCYFRRAANHGVSLSLAGNQQSGLSAISARRHFARLKLLGRLNEAAFRNIVLALLFTSGVVLSFS